MTRWIAKAKCPWILGAGMGETCTTCVASQMHMAGCYVMDAELDGSRIWFSKVLLAFLTEKQYVKTLAWKLWRYINLKSRRLPRISLSFRKGSGYLTIALTLFSPYEMMSLSTSDQACSNEQGFEPTASHIQNQKRDHTGSHWEPNVLCTLYPTHSNKAWIKLLHKNRKYHAICEKLFKKNQMQTS